MQFLRNTFAEINLMSLRQNLRLVKDCLPDSSKMYFCVKADAYGHGSVEAAYASEKENIKDFAVELAEEGRILRENGIKGEIIVMGRANLKQMECACLYELNQCVADEEDIYNMQNISLKIGKPGMVHLKVDSGMGRIGIINKNALYNVIKALKKCTNVKINGMFTHFACADEEDKTYTHYQASVFNSFVNIMNNEGYFPKIHMANSAACIDFPEYGMDYGRCGIAAYGYQPKLSLKRHIPNLTPVMSVYAEISQIKEIPPNFNIGYNATFKSTKDMRIATIQIGYADGYPRELSNKGRVLIKGTDGYSYAPIVGRICMDQTMVDITAINGVKVGDLALVLGKQNELSVDAVYLANICNTISYEILTGISKRVPRFYIDEY